MPPTHFVCGGHGAVRPSHGGQFQIPKGITVYFYVAHGSSLANSEGKKIDQYVNDGPGAVAHVGQPLSAGQDCRPYHLYNHKGGGYLKLKMSSEANCNYITHSGPGGKALKDILNDIQGCSTDAHVHWSACRATEADTDPVDFAEDRPPRVDLSRVKTRRFGGTNGISDMLNVALNRPPGTDGALTFSNAGETPTERKLLGMFSTMKLLFGKLKKK